MRNADTAAANEPTPAPYPALGVACVLGVLYFVWGSTYLGIRVAVEHLPPFYMASIRFLLAGGSLYQFLRLRGGGPLMVPRQLAPGGELSSPWRARSASGRISRIDFPVACRRSSSASHSKSSLP